MSGVTKFLAVAFALTAGRSGKLVRVSDVQKQWPQHLLNAAYSPKFYPMAKSKKWVLPERRNPGSFVVTQAGVDHLDTLIVRGQVASQGLLVFGTKSAHEFDKTIRSIFAGAQKVDIADSYVDESIFDVTLDSIPKPSQIRLLYGQVSPAKQQSVFDARGKRFQNDYQSFEVKQSGDFHDRLLIVDGKGHLLGPSLKNAAEKKPALLMSLNQSDSNELTKFFEDLWLHGK